MVGIGIRTSIDLGVEFALLNKLGFLYVLQKQPLSSFLFKFVLYKIHILD